MSIQIKSSLNPSYDANPTALHLLQPITRMLNLPLLLPSLLLLVVIRELALCSQPYTVLGLRGRGSHGRGLEKPLHALPLSDEPVKPVELPYGWHIPTTRLERCSCLFEGPCAFSSCQYDDKERVQDPWELVTLNLALDSPNAQRLEIQILVGDRRGDLQAGGIWDGLYDPFVFRLGRFGCFDGSSTAGEAGRGE
ncbi:hypothetical protein BKA70DRAFT_691118 [Coprinopsis sp. MPI-PUGE-AT-0042]|nr:hypothetical protein BKA70DRAFT_691118 [Coprinopsis sp. MPI-PUGE-AT-0042]